MAAFLALLSAAFFAGNAVAVRLALRGSTPEVVTLLSVATNVLTLWTLAAVTGPLVPADQGAALIFLAAGVLAPGLARLAMYTAIGRIGIAPTVVASNTTPLFTVAGAALLLGERLTAGVLVGTVAVVLGVVLTSSAPPLGRGTASPPEARPRRGGIALALSTAVLAAVSFLLRKVGLERLPAPALAAALTQTGALSLLLPLVLLRGRRERPRLGRTALLPALAAGLLSTGGFLTYFLALHQGAVSRVTPLSSTTPLFAVLLLGVGYRQVEAVSARTAAGAALTVAGVVLVVAG